MTVYIVSHTYFHESSQVMAVYRDRQRAVEYIELKIESYGKGFEKKNYNAVESWSWESLQVSYEIETFEVLV